MLEELLALGHAGAEYDAWLIKIGEGDQFGSGFVAVNPNSKIPALVDRSGPKPIRVFESGAILLYLAEKFGAFLPKDGAARAECLSWLFWQMGSAPYLGGGFGHFYAYAPTKIEYAIDRFAMETKRQLDVLDRRLGESQVSWPATTTPSPTSRCGRGTAAWPRACSTAPASSWRCTEYKNVQRWADTIGARPAVKRGRIVNRLQGDPASQLHERHDASDFELEDAGQAGGRRHRGRPDAERGGPACAGRPCFMMPRSLNRRSTNVQPARLLVAVVMAHPGHGEVEPVLVAALGREVEQPVGVHHHLHAAAVGRVGVEDLARVVLPEDADAGHLLARRLAAEIVVGLAVRHLVGA